MFQMHSWMVIRVSYEAIEEKDDRCDEVIENVKKLAEELEFNSIALKAQNGDYYFEHTIFGNRKRSDYKEFLEFINQINMSAPGSYGLVYVYDDEDLENYNEFQVFSISRGAVHSHKDTFLSPVIPTIEDPWY